MLYTVEDFCGSKFMSVPSVDARMDVCPYERMGCVKGCGRGDGRESEIGAIGFGASAGRWRCRPGCLVAVCFAS